MKTQLEENLEMAPDYCELQGMLAACRAASKVDPVVFEIPLDYTTDAQRRDFRRGWVRFFEAAGQPWDEALEMFNIPQ